MRVIELSKDDVSSGPYLINVDHITDMKMDGEQPTLLPGAFWRKLGVPPGAEMRVYFTDSTFIRLRFSYESEAQKVWDKIKGAMCA